MEQTADKISQLIWYSIPNYEGYYEINKVGQIRGIDRLVVTNKGLRNISSRYLKTRINNDGYIDVRLSKDGKTTTTFIHKLIAETFIPNPYKKKEVNHINGIKTDNRLENLEWVTHKENMIHAHKLGLLYSFNKNQLN
jgi:hypothetical protein